MTVPVEVSRFVESEIVVARELSDLILSVEIADQPDLDFAETQLRAIATEKRRIDEDRKKITGPLHQAWKAANDHFRPLIEAYDAPEKFLRKAISAYLLKIEKERVSSMYSLAPVARPAELSSKTSSRTVTKFRVVDASLVPREYCSPDLKKISAAPDIAGIPGVETYEEIALTVRGES